MSSKRLWYLSCAIAALIVLIVAYLITDWLRFLNGPIFQGNNRVVFQIPARTSFAVVSKRLKEQGLIRNDRYFVVLAYTKGVSKSIKAGEYGLTSQQTPADLLQMFVDGRVIQHDITFVEGWNVHEIIAAVTRNPAIVKTLNYQHPDSLLAQLGINSIHPEGLFYPDTYHFPTGTTDKDVLLRAYNNMQQQLQNAWQHRDITVPYTTPYQALIAASLIEKETALAFERPLVASVITNRLLRGMRLQIDPTLIYALGANYRGKLHADDKNFVSPYNTYKYSGLPPTPIAIPSIASIEAALKPAQTNYLYYVAKGNGSHQFSATYDEQLTAIQKFIKKRQLTE